MAAGGISYVRPFDGTGFSTWMVRVKTCLGRHGVASVLESQEVKENEKEAFRKLDAHARDIIVQSVSDNVLEIIKEKSTAKDMIETLKSTYEKKGLASRIDLQRKFRNLSMAGGSNLQSFLLEFDRTLAELKMAGGKMDDDEVIIQLLSAMPSDFKAVVTSIDVLFSKEPETVTLDFVKSKLLSEERRLSPSANEDGNGESFSAVNKGGRNNYGKFKPKFFGRCYECQEKGHKSSQCPKRRRTNQYRSENRSRFPDNRHQRNRYGHFSGNVEDNKPITFFTEVIKSESTYLGEPPLEIEFVIDSGASCHLVKSCFEEHFFDKIETHKKIGVAKEGECIVSSASGKLSVVAESGCEITLKNVLLCKHLTRNLLSVKCMEETGLKVIFENKKVSVLKGRDRLFGATLVGNLYIAKFHIVPGSLVNLVKTDEDLIHRRMGHSSRYPTTTLCETCIYGKQARAPYLKSIPEEKKATRILDCVASDVCGPFDPPTFDGFKYFITFIDCYSHFTMCYLLRRKSEAFDAYREYRSYVFNRFGRDIVRLRVDNGGEYVSHDFKSFCRSKGTQIEYTVPRNPSQNGIAERMNRTITEMSRCLLFDSNLDKKFWGEAVRSSVYIINRLPTNALRDKRTPAELWFGVPPDLDKIKCFGSAAYTHVSKEDRRGKLDQRSRRCLMMGYAPNGYRLWDPTSGKIILARSVIFDETSGRVPVFRGDISKKQLNEVDEDKEEEVCPEEEPKSTDEEEPKTDANEDEFKTGTKENTDGNRRTSKRTIRAPQNLEDYELYECLLSEIPVNFNEAVKSPDGDNWMAAMKEELAAMKRHHAWDLVERPKGKSVVKCRWVYSIKNSESGVPVKYKARLVAKGFTQKQGIDYKETFSPVVSKSSLRLLFALAAKLNLSVHHLDINTAFLNGDLSEVIFMEQPEGFIDVNNKNKVCLLKKAIYGLKQSSRVWNQKIEKELLSINFLKSKFEPCIFFKITENGYTFIAVHVDDFLIFTSDVSELNNLKKFLNSKFSVKDLGKARYCLGLNISVDKDKIKINQKPFIVELLKKFNMWDSKPVKTPMESKVVCDSVDNDYVDPDVPYQSLIGSLMYLAVNSRPDIAYVTSYLSQFNTCYKRAHWNAAKRVLRYLKGTLDLGLTYFDNGNSLTGYTDADWANDHVDRKSYSGFIFKLCNGPVAWEAKKQPCVSLSSTEAEYVSITCAAKEAVFLKGLLNELIKVNVAIPIYNDNQSAQRLVYNPVFHNRTKHIDTKFHFIRELVSKGEVVVKYLSTDQMYADMFTKPLPVAKFTFCRDGVGLI